MKKSISFVLAAILCCSTIPMSVSAESAQKNLTGLDLKYDANLDGSVDFNDSDCILYYYSCESVGIKCDLSEKIVENIASNCDFTNNGITDGGDAAVLMTLIVNSGHKDGDVNNDGIVNAIDASLILSFYADKQTGSIDKYSDEEIQMMYGFVTKSTPYLIDANVASKVLYSYSKEQTK